MPMEIERRFLVTECRFRTHGKRPVAIEQGYFESGAPNVGFRVRIYDQTTAEITTKTGRGIERDEANHALALDFARVLFEEVASYRLRKNRFKEQGWEVDFFAPPLAGVVLAEFEARTRGGLPEILPEWIGRGIDVTDALTNLHLARFAALLGPSGAEPLPLLVTRLANRVKKIALTGAPCSGKDGVLKALREEFPHIRFVPEVATILIGEVGILPGNDPLANRRFQQTVYRTQDVFEWTSVEAAIESGQVAALFNRGRVESAAYLAGGMAEFEELQRTTRRHEYAHYDAVLYIEEPSREVFEEFRVNNSARQETSYEAVLELAQRTRRAWQDHPNFIFIRRHENWEAKVDAVRRVLRAIVGERANR